LVCLVDLVCLVEAEKPDRSSRMLKKAVQQGHSE
jgi:hypothetical protein